MIDRETVEKIKDAANIVDVVSEFVTLRKAGANYKGLCPFHDEKTPSFIVSPSRGTCHCFGCGKGGNPVGFIMEHEQMSYPEALRWLAGKYHIEIRERELSDDERREQSERESMFIVNDWASRHFRDLLHNHPDGVAVGMQYFRSRGFRDDVIEKFQLGFDITDRHALSAAAQSKGYKADFIVATGLCYRNDRGELIDRFAGRVIFPWIGVSGKVVGFGGRLLDARTKGVNQKYVNSPDSEIYHKDRELYGIWQAKKAIAKEDRVFMVEGYTDVISMHQCGIENVVANSGTALSVHQIHMLHRFTGNITLLYDGDEAGIHAAMRGTDMLLSEGMNLKVVLLPDGDDPDSFSRKHTAADFRRFIEEHQKDFIEFKSDLLLRNERDPLKRSEAINSVVKSISLVRDQILRDTYVHDCAVRLQISEATLINTMNKFIRSEREQHYGPQMTTPAVQQPSPKISAPVTPMQQASEVERMLMQMLVRHGDAPIVQNAEDDEGNLVSLNLAQYLDYNLSVDELQLGNPLYRRMLAEAVAYSAGGGSDMEQFLVHHDDIDISREAATLCADRYHLTDVSGKERDDVSLDDADRAVVEQDRLDALRQQLDHLLNDFRMDYLEQRLRMLQSEIASASADADRLRELLQEYKTMHELRSRLAALLGNNIIV